MSVVAANALPYLPLERPEFDENPFPFLDAARLEHPWLARVQNGHFVHGYQAIKDLSFMDDVLRPAFDGVVQIYGAEGTEWGRFMENNIINLTGERHARIRSSIALAFTPRNVNRFRGLMRDRVNQLLDEWAPKGEFDFTDFASLFPISVLCALLGTSTDAIPRIHGALEAQGQTFSLDKSKLPELLAGYEVMTDYIAGIVAEREKSGPSGDDSLLDSLIATKNAGQISAEELRDLLLVLFPAGYDTSKNALAFTIHTLLQNPGHWERCAGDVDYCAKVVDEMLRFSSTAAPFRIVSQDFDYDGVHFTEGEVLFFGNPISGRDPAAFPEGDSFRPGCPHKNHHLAFGRGAHICVGQHLARAQITEGLHVITQRLKNPRLVGEVTWRIFLGTWGPRTLPIAFDPPTTRKAA